jgi:hypothetical protein
MAAIRRIVRFVLPLTFLGVPLFMTLTPQEQANREQPRVINQSTDTASCGTWRRTRLRAQGRGTVGGGRGGPPPSVEPGTYVVTLNAGGKTYSKPVTVLQDRWLDER